MRISKFNYVMKLRNIRKYKLSRNKVRLGNIRKLRIKGIL